MNSKKQMRDRADAEAKLRAEEAKAQYEKLVLEVRMHRHELGNQLSVVKSLAADDASRYLEELNADQRHNVLLLCGDPLLAGLLYQKCTEAESQGIRVENHVFAKLEQYALPQHELIASVGVLLDNAIEAELTCPEGERSIRILVDEEDGRYRITVANRYPYVPYEEMGKWFRVGHTSKGKERGIGLAHIRRICESGKADIAYGNQETDGENEVVFMLYLEKEAETAGDVAGQMLQEAEGQEKSGQGKSGREKNGAERADGEKSGREKFGEEKSGQERTVGRKQIAVWCLGIVGAGAVIAIVTGLFFAMVQKRRMLPEESASYEKTEGSYSGREQGTAEMAERIGMIEAAETAETERIPAIVVSGEETEISRPYLLYDESHLPDEGGELIDLPRTDLWSAEATKLATVSYEIYDTQGRHIGRDTYVSYDMDTPLDKRAMVDRGIRLDFYEGEYYRRGQERWDYDTDGQEISYRKYKQYGEQLEPELVSEEAYSEEHSLPDEEGNWTWNESGRRAYVTDTDYYGDTYEFVYDYDEEGRKTAGYYLRDGVYYRGYEAIYDAGGRIIEEYDNMPFLQRERLPDAFRDTFYDEERTQQRKPQEYRNRYRYHLYGAGGEETYLLDIDAYYGYGDLWVYCYDEQGRLAVTYDYRIWASRLPEFALNMPSGGFLYLDNAFYDYVYYEKYGVKMEGRRFYLTEILREDATGKILWSFTFDKDGPKERRLGDQTVDWTEEVVLKEGL